MENNSYYEDKTSDKGLIAISEKVFVQIANDVLSELREEKKIAPVGHFFVSLYDLWNTERKRDISGQRLRKAIRLRSLSEFSFLSDKIQKSSAISKRKSMMKFSKQPKYRL